LCLAVFVLALAWSPGSAYADGDPASDVLAVQRLFLAQDAGVPAGQQAQLGAELSAAQRSGYQIRVAIIASSTDLGSVTELWRQPQSYAKFLGQELSLVYRGPLLVVMPNGFGTYGLGQAAAGLSALTGVRVRGLGAAALAAIQRLASTAGHALPIPSATASPKPGQNDTVSWIVFAIGGAFIAGAWVASLRARPPHLPHRNTASA
jgi:hypothetical protein